MTNIGNLTLLVTNRLKCFMERFNSLGGKLLCSVDPRVAVHVPKGTFRIGADITLKVRLLILKCFCILSFRVLIMIMIV